MVIGARTGAWKASGGPTPPISGNIIYGGTISQIGDDVLISFLDVGSGGLIVVENEFNSRILLVGGGGGGGGMLRNNGAAASYAGGGGGGAGGFFETNALFSAANYFVQVGAGGAAAKNLNNSPFKGGNGEPTTILFGGEDWIKAVGGGGGGGQCAGQDGASGGGGSYKNGAFAGGSVSEEAQRYGNLGFAGGAGVAWYAGGGGGAGGVGAAGDSAKHGVGGVGRQSGITLPNDADPATWPYYAGGGGGGQSSTTTGSTSGIAGGLGGGGQGGIGNTPAEGGKAKAGDNGFGGGGGGAGNCKLMSTAGKGGSGVAYVRALNRCLSDFTVATPSISFVATVSVGSIVSFRVHGIGAVVIFGDGSYFKSDDQVSIISHTYSSSGGVYLTVYNGIVEIYNKQAISSNSDIIGVPCTFISYDNGTDNASLRIPSSVNSIASNSFSGCSGSIDLYGHTGRSDSSYIDNTFGNCFVKCKGTSLNDYEFFKLESLYSIEIGNSVTSLGDHCFYYCSGLTSITIPSSVTSLGDYCFYYCSGLTSITISSSVTSLGDYCFGHCSGLTSITCHCIVPPHTLRNSFFDVPNNIPVYVPANSITAYQNAVGWSQFTNFQPIT